MNRITHHFEFLKELFDTEHISFVMDSIIEGKKEASVYINDISRPTSALVWDKGHCVYLNAGIHNQELDLVIECLRHQILAPEVRQTQRVLKLYISHESNLEFIMDRIKDLKPKRYFRSLFKYDIDLPGIGFFYSGDLIIQDINEKMISRTEMENHPLMINEIRGMWGDVQTFLDEGFGFCAIIEDKVVGWCTSEYASKNNCGVGIETVENYQGKGIATLLTQYFINKCKDQFITPYWDCWKENIPSVKAAEKSGFKKVKEYEIVLLELI